MCHLFYKMGVKTLKKGRNVPFSLTMHPVTRIYWTHGYGKFRQPKRMRKETTGRNLLMHGTDARKIYWMHGWQSLRIIRTHALHGANSWSVEKTSTLFDQSNCRDSLTHFIKLHVYLKHASGDLYCCARFWC